MAELLVSIAVYVPVLRNSGSDEVVNCIRAYGIRIYSYLSQADGFRCDARLLLQLSCPAVQVWAETSFSSNARFSLYGSVFIDDFQLQIIDS